MYCNNCHNLLKDGEHICPKCGFDNDATIDLSSVVRKINKKEEKRNNMVLVVILLIVLCIGIIAIYLIGGTKDEGDIPITNVPSSTTSTEESKIKKLKFNDISLEYSTEVFKKQGNNLLLNTNNDIYISIEDIDANEYNDEINGNECLDYKLNELLVKTFAGDDFYSYIFMLKDKYYNITIHYINEAIQLEVNKVLNTIKQK